MARVTYTGSQPGAVPGQPAWKPGESRDMAGGAAAAFIGHPLFAVEADIAPELPAPVPEPPARKPAKSEE